MTQRQGVPLPTIIEVLVMEVTFEILREAGLRLPRPIGQAMSIVGALVIGQAAVQAGLVMATTVIIVATTAIMSFTIPGFFRCGCNPPIAFPIINSCGNFRTTRLYFRYHDDPISSSERSFFWSCLYGNSCTEQIYGYLLYTGTRSLFHDAATHPLVILITPTAVLYIPSLVMQQAGNGGWISPALSLLFGLFVTFMVYGLAKAYPGKTLSEYIPLLTGTILGQIFAVLYALFFWHVGLLVAREIIWLIHTLLLLNTPAMALYLLVFS